MHERDVLTIALHAISIITLSGRVTGGIQCAVFTLSQDTVHSSPCSPRHLAEAALLQRKTHGALPHVVPCLRGRALHRAMIDVEQLIFTTLLVEATADVVSSIGSPIDMQTML